MSRDDGEEEEMLSARVPSELKDLVDADSRSNQEVVRSALWSEFGGKRKGDLESRLNEKEKRMTLVQEEKKSRESELSELEKEANAIRKKLRKVENEEQSKLEDAKETLDGVPKHPENEAIQTWADKIGITPEELIEKLGESE